jgi:HAD superfamily hydrolase (TIGR01509 family)
MELLIIFDLDGTLVDSERLCNQAFVDLLPSLNETVDELVHLYRGKRLVEILNDLERRVPTRLPDKFEQIYRERVSALFATDLKAIDGAAEMLRNLSHPFCIASSGPPEKIIQALAVTGLSEYFGDRFFSSYVVGSWKPEPGLLLHAATKMGFSPQQCVVIEDSEIGLQAAEAAGMRALHFVPDMRLPKASNAFSEMSALPSILQKIARPSGLD